MFPALINKVAILRDRAHMLATSRQFFSEREVLEVDVPLLSKSAPIDVHIDLVEATCCQKSSFLHSSPEYGMKRLLADGIGDIFQLSHVFRDGELGDKHHPEFTMVEWYRHGFSFEKMIEETLDFLRLFLPVEKVTTLTYREAFQKIGGKAYEEVEDRDAFFAFEIEPYLGHDCFTVILDFPVQEAALAQIRWNGKEHVAERFEISYRGMELANGYHELADFQDQKRRLEEANKKRETLGKAFYPIDHYFLSALQKGIPDCCGVAVGFDRLMMLRHDIKEIQEVIPFSWDKT